MQGRILRTLLELIRQEHKPATQGGGSSSLSTPTEAQNAETQSDREREAFWGLDNNATQPLNSRGAARADTGPAPATARDS